MADEHCTECPECGSFVTSTAQQCGASCGRLEDLRTQLTAANARVAELEGEMAILKEQSPIALNLSAAHSAQLASAANARADALAEALTATLSPLINSSDVLDVMDSDDAGHLPEARAILRRWRDECREAHAKARAALTAAKVPR